MPTREELIQAIQTEMAKRQDPNRITTREQAVARAEEMDAGGLEAGPWYMDMAKDVLNPVDAVAGIATGGARAAGEGVEQLAKVGTRPIAIAGERQAAIDMVKAPAKLESYTRGLLDDAAGKMSTRIDSKEDALRTLIKGRQGNINPDVVSEVMPHYGAKLAQRRGTETVRGSMGEPIEQVAQQGQVQVPLESLLRVKRVGDKLKKYSPTDAMNPNAAPRMQNASRASDVARQQIYDNAPGSEDILAEMGKDIKLKNFLTKRAQKNPVSTVQSKPATLKDSVLAQVDDAAGTNLRGAGQRLEQAKGDLIEPANFLRPLQAPAEIAKTVKRGVLEVGAVGDDILKQGASLPGAKTGAKALGWGTALEAGDDLSVPDAEPVATPEQPSREQLIEQIQAEIRRRQGQ